MSNTRGFKYLATDPVATQYQVAPHAGFRPEEIAIADPVRTTIGEPRVWEFATPPDWMSGAKCLGRWEEYDQDDKKITPLIAEGMCHGCPVVDQCLADALALEKDAPLLRRQGVRGGMTPRQRLNLDRGIVEVCRGGHERTRENTSYRRRPTGTWERDCTDCLAERRRVS